MMPHKDDISLMPQPLQSVRLRRLYLSRAQQAAAALAAALLLAAAAHAGAWWWLRTQLPAGSGTVLQEADSTPAADIARLNAFLYQFEQRRQEIVMWTPLLSDVFAAVPAGVQVTAVEGNAAMNTLQVSGVAVERAAIIGFQRQLEQAAWVVELTAPLSNLSIGSVNAFTFIVSLGEEAL